MGWWCRWWRCDHVHYCKWCDDDAGGIKRFDFNSTVWGPCKSGYTYVGIWAWRILRGDLDTTLKNKSHLNSWLLIILLGILSFFFSFSTVVVIVVPFHTHTRIHTFLSGNFTSKEYHPLHGMAECIIVEGTWRPSFHTIVPAQRQYRCWKRTSDEWTSADNNRQGEREKIEVCMSMSVFMCVSGQEIDEFKQVKKSQF